MPGFGQAIRVLWNGQSLVPDGPRWSIAARRQLVAGETYMIREHEQQSDLERAHLFAFTRTAWQNLPEDSVGLPYAISPEHLRKFALIKCGFCDTKIYPCKTAAEAQRWSVFLRPMDEFSIVTVDGAVVTVWTAQSQSPKAMGAKTFQESKRAVAEYMADLIGVTADDLLETDTYKRTGKSAVGQKVRASDASAEPASTHHIGERNG